MSGHDVAAPRLDRRLSHRRRAVPDRRRRGPRAGGRDRPGAAALRRHGARPGPPSGRRRAPRPCRHVRRLRHRARRHGGRPGGRLLPQRGLLDRLRAWHDRPGDLGDRVGPGPGPPARRHGHGRRPVGPAGLRRHAGARTASTSARSGSGTSRRSSSPAASRSGHVAGPGRRRRQLRRRVLRERRCPALGLDVSTASLPALIALQRELRPAIDAAARGRPSRRARMRGHLRRDLLAGRADRRRRPGGRGGPDPAQRDRLRRRRGRPLAVRQRHLGPAGPARPARAVSGRRRAAPCATGASSIRPSSAGSSGRPRWPVVPP